MSEAYETGTTTDRNNPGLRKLRGNGQQESYLVLSAEERSKGFVMPVRRTYRHITCRQNTSMSRDIAETYARNPKFYGGTFCTNCGTHFQLVENGIPQFVWVGDDGRCVNAFVGEGPEDVQRRLDEDAAKAASVVAAWPEVNRMAGVLTMYVIYDRPVDHPDRIVTRKFLVSNEPQPTKEFLLHDSIEDARIALPNGLWRIPRSLNDEPQIIETWI